MKTYGQNNRQKEKLVGNQSCGPNVTIIPVANTDKQAAGWY